MLVCCSRNGTNPFGRYGWSGQSGLSDGLTKNDARVRIVDGRHDRRRVHTLQSGKSIDQLTQKWRDFRSFPAKGTTKPLPNLIANRAAVGAIKSQTCMVPAGYR
jgi:hypothetical protein